VPEGGGGQELDQLLAALSVAQRPGAWCLLSGVAVPPEVVVQASVVEDEGTTVVVSVAEAERLGQRPDFVAAWLTLEVASALDAVGLTAAVARALADRGIACNVLAGFHHDHLLVPHDRAAEAVEAIEALRSDPRRGRLSP
jgi:hypothetical protein